MKNISEIARLGHFVLCAGVVLGIGFASYHMGRQSGELGLYREIMGNLAGRLDVLPIRKGTGK